LGPPPSSIDGQWAFRISNLRATLQGVTVVCSSTGTTLDLTQSGTGFSGTYSGGTITCTAQGQSSTSSFGSGAVANGSLVGASVSFDLDTPDFHFVGSAGQDQMTGTCTLTMDLGPPYGVLTMQGSWRATR
jgi:hypothetical protein